jgi:hypothetical protein
VIAESLCGICAISVGFWTTLSMPASVEVLLRPRFQTPTQIAQARCRALADFAD